MKNQNDNLRKLTRCALFAALITLSILFFRIPIPLPGSAGYVHPGDSLIYLVAYLLPGPFAVAAAAIGGALADLLAGAIVYTFPTAVIKALMAWVASLLFAKNNRLSLHLCLTVLLGCLITVGGYFLFELTVFGLAYAVSGILWNLGQSIASGILAGVMIYAFRFIHQNQRLMGDRSCK